MQICCVTYTRQGDGIIYGQAENHLTEDGGLDFEGVIEGWEYADPDNPVKVNEQVLAVPEE